MAILGFDLDEIARLIALVEEGDLDEIILEEEGRKLRIRGPRAQRQVVTQTVNAPAPAGPMPALPPAPRRPAPATAPPAAEEGTTALLSPMVGVFYRAGKPGDPPLIEVGQRIAVDQPIGLIEAMKIFSEIPAEHGGIVVAIPAKDGALVQAGMPLVIVKTD
jgi:acetyl-CoA carboxylase biotin carboxyl carrier protein